MDRGQEAVRAHFEAKMPKRVRRAFELAYAELYNGPMTTEDRRAHELPIKMSWNQAVDILKSWWSEVGGDVYYDMQSGYVDESEPQGFEDEETGEYIEPEWSDFVHWDSADARKAVFGTELSQYVR